MSFLHPEFIYYMLPPLVILFGFLLTQKDAEAQFFSKEVIDKLRVSTNTMTQRARNALFFVVGVLIILALAEPVIDDGKVTVKAKSADIMIALDISDSMLAQDLYPNRLELAKQKALSFLQEMKSQRVGVMAFAKGSYLVSPLSFDTAAVAYLLKQLDTNSITQRGTNFLTILESFAKHQEKKDQKYLLLLSDGGDDSDFSDEIKFAKENNIVVFVLGTASKKGAPVKKEDGSFIEQNGKIIISKLNQEIATLATKSGGVYIESTLSNTDIKAMLKEIKNKTNEKELKSEEIHKYIPLFYYPIGLALFLLLIATSSMPKRAKVELPFLLIFCVLGIFTLESKASMLDFIDLDEAKEAYEKKDYKRSSELYENYAQKSKKGESYFNAANAFYKQKEYKKAIDFYERASFDTKEMRAKNSANLGNAYAKSGELQKAVDAYESSLELQEDTQTKENLQRVKDLLKEQEKEQEKQQQDKEEKQDKQEKQDSSDSSDSNDADDSSNEKDESKQDESSSKSSHSQEKQSDESRSKKEDEEKQEAKDAKDKQEKKEQLDKLGEDKKESNDGSDGSAKELQEAQMSDAEERKWLEELSTQNSSFMYRLSDDNPTKDTSDEKPW